MQRRDVLRSLAVAMGVCSLPAMASSPLVPKVLGAEDGESAERLPAHGTWPGTLVLLELKGGNDGLNTVVPYADPDYARLRPNLAIARDQVLALDEHLGLHPALEPLLPSWRADELALVLGVGYAQPNRSHFRSIAIWETGSDRDEVLEQGWLARWMPVSVRQAGSLPDLVVLGGEAGVAEGGDLRVISLKRPEGFVREAARLRAESPSTPVPDALRALLAERQTIREAGRGFEGYLDRLDALPVAFPATSLGRQLEQAARMLVAGMRIPVLKVRIGSFDTHAGQRARHDRLLGELAQALAAFRESLRAADLWDSVLVMSYSEFGRRAAENASQGTDHGAASMQFVLGGRVKGGLYGEQPSLTELDQGDLRYNIDYRQLYATVAQGWWGDEDPGRWRRFPALGFLA